MGYDIFPSVVACSPVTAPLVLPGSPQAYKTHQGYKRSRAKGSRPGEAEALVGVAGGGRVEAAKRRPAALRDAAPTAAAHHPRGTRSRPLGIRHRSSGVPIIPVLHPFRNIAVRGRLEPPPAPSQATPPAAALPAAPRDHRRPLPAGRSRTRRGFYVRCYAACAWGRSSRASRAGVGSRVHADSVLASGIPPASRAWAAGCRGPLPPCTSCSVSCQSCSSCWRVANCKVCTAVTRGPIRQFRGATTAGTAICLAHARDVAGTARSIIERGCVRLSRFAGRIRRRAWRQTAPILHQR